MSSSQIVDNYLCFPNVFCGEMCSIGKSQTSNTAWLHDKYFHEDFGFVTPNTKFLWKRSANQFFAVKMEISRIVSQYFIQKYMGSPRKIRVSLIWHREDASPFLSNNPEILSFLLSVYNSTDWTDYQPHLVHLKFANSGLILRFCLLWHQMTVDCILLINFTIQSH